MKKHLLNVLFLILFGILVYSIIEMPTMQTVDAPSYNEVTEYYIENAVNETGSVNFISAILADYRGFDTLGETIVLFTSVVAVASVLRTVKKKEEEEA